MDEQPEHEVDTSPTPDQMSSMANFTPPIKPKHILKSLLKLVLFLIIIGAIIAGVILLVSHHTAAKTPAPAKQSTTTQTNTTTKISATTKHYDSTNYSLGFNYPEDWKINDDATSKLTVTSPAVQLRDATNQLVTEQIVLTIENKQTTVPQFAAGTVIAAIQSQKISYKTPTPNQRAQTYVTFASYKGIVTTIDALYITGDNGYQAAQFIPQSDIIQDDPLISISFLKCTDTACKAAGTAGTIAASSWQDASLSTPLLNILESLIIS